MSDGPAYRIGSVDNALRLLALVTERRHIRLTDAAAELDIALSTAHRLMRMLQHHELVVQDPDSRLYAAGPQLRRLGRLAEPVDLRAAALPALEGLVAEVGETVHLWVPHGADEIRCIVSVESPQALRIGARTGAVLPVAPTASGQALRGTDPDVRARGYAVQRDAWDEGVSAVAAAIPTPEPGAPAIAAVAIAVPSARMAGADVDALGAAAVRCAARVAAALP